MIFLQTSHAIIAVFLIALILLQSKGVGLSAAFGGGGEIYQTKRGAEKAIFILTIILAGLFTLTSLLNVVFS